MTMNESDDDRALANLLPFYATGKLSLEDMRRVERALAGDAELRRELALVEEEHVATVEAKAFLGDRLDFQVRAGNTVLLARVHPSLRTPVGDKIYVRMQADKCLAVPDARAR